METLPPTARKRKRRPAITALLVLAVIAVAVRYVLFRYGVLYGEAAAKMASLAVAGVIVAAGYIPLRILRGGQWPDDASSKESIVATVVAILGLAITAYSVSELIAPNTPIAAAAPACAGVPVNGAPFFATTPANGANAHSGPGREYQQANRYGGNCTLGFDGYCIGPAELDLILNTPDQRWLLVHDRNQLISSAVVLSQSPESDLGTTPSPDCAKLGGLPQPSAISQFSYNAHNGHLSAAAPGAVAVGYGLTTTRTRDRVYHTGALGRNPAAGFPATLPPAGISGAMQITDGDIWLAAAICLADNVPVVASLRVQRLTLRNSQIISEAPDTHLRPATRLHLAEIACNSTR